MIKESEKAVAETKKAEETKDASKQSAPDLHPLKKSLEDHDSSGTCSADEDARVAQSKVSCFLLLLSRTSTRQQLFCH